METPVDNRNRRALRSIVKGSRARPKTSGLQEPTQAISHKDVGKSEVIHWVDSLNNPSKTISLEVLAPMPVNKEPNTGYSPRPWQIPFCLL